MRASHLIVIAVLATAACGRQRRGEPEGPTVRPDTASEARGQRLYQRWCYQCHPGGEAGLGPGLNDKPLPELVIETQIRKGYGAMPAFSSEMLSDGDVAALADFVQEMRATPATNP